MKYSFVISAGMVTPHTVTNCFKKSGISSQPAEVVESSMEVEEIIDSNVLGPITFEDFLSFDNDLAASIAYDTVFHETVSIVHDHDNEEDNENNDNDNSDLPLSCIEDVLKPLDILQRYMSEHQT
jgi:hypothetical protein